MNDEEEEPDCNDRLEVAMTWEECQPSGARELPSSLRASPTEISGQCVLCREEHPCAPMGQSTVGDQRGVLHVGRAPREGLRPYVPRPRCPTRHEAVGSGKGSKGSRAIGSPQHVDVGTRVEIFCK